MRTEITSTSHLERILKGGYDAAGKYRGCSDAESDLLNWLKKHNWVTCFLKQVVPKAKPAEKLDREYSDQVRRVAYNHLRNEIIITERQMGAELRLRFHDHNSICMAKKAAWHSYGDLKTAIFYRLFGGILEVMGKHHSERHENSFFKELQLSEQMRALYPSQRPNSGSFVLESVNGFIEVNI